MLIVSITMAFIAGLLIGAVAAYDKGFLAGRKWGYQLGSERADDLVRIDRIRSLI